MVVMQIQAKTFSHLKIPITMTKIDIFVFKNHKKANSISTIYNLNNLSEYITII